MSQEEPAVDESLNEDEDSEAEEEKEEDIELRRVFVDKLDRRVTKNDITKHFEKFGELESVTRRVDRRHKDRVFAFVVFNSAEACLEATSSPEITIRGYKCVCWLAAIGAAYSGFDYFTSQGLMKRGRIEDMEATESVVSVNPISSTPQQVEISHHQYSPMIIGTPTAMTTPAITPVSVPLLNHAYVAPVQTIRQQPQPSFAGFSMGSVPLSVPSVPLVQVSAPQQAYQSTPQTPVQSSIYAPSRADVQAALNQTVQLQLLLLKQIQQRLPTQ
jgi:hypothetical protein